MKLKFSAVNDGELTWIKAGIRQSTEEKNKLTEHLLQYDEPIRIAVPHKVFHLSVEEVLQLNAPSTTFEGDIRQYLIITEKDIIAAASIVQTTDGKYSVKFNYGEYVKYFKDIFIKLESTDNKKVCTFSIIKIPELYIMVVWLQAKNENLFMPFGNSPQEIESYKIYSENEFFAALLKISGKHQTA